MVFLRTCCNLFKIFILVAFKKKLVVIYFKFKFWLDLFQIWLQFISSMDFGCNYFKFRLWLHSFQIQLQFILNLDFGYILFKVGCNFKFDDVFMWLHLQANMIMFVNPYCMLGMYCICPLLENIDFLMQFSYAIMWM